MDTSVAIFACRNTNAITPDMMQKMIPDRAALAKALSATMRQNGISQLGLEKYSGINRTTIRRVQRGDNITLDSYDRVEQAIINWINDDEKN